MRNWMRFALGLLVMTLVGLCARESAAFPGQQNVNGSPVGFYITSGQWGGGTGVGNGGGCPSCHGDSSGGPTITLQASSGVSGSGTSFSVVAGTPNNVLSLSYPSASGCNACATGAYTSGCTQCDAGGFLVMHADAGATDTGMGKLSSLDGTTHECRTGSEAGCGATTNGATEVMHAQPLVTSGPAFVFGYTAPSTCGTYNFVLWVNAVNGDSSCGPPDDPNFLQFSIAVTCPDDSNNPCSIPACFGGSCGFSPAAVNTACADDGLTCTRDICDGVQTTCQHPAGNPGVVCRPQNGTCDVAEACNGSNPACPADGFASSGTCRPSAGVCDIAESCNGSGPNCPPDTFQAGNSCRGAVDICDKAEVCAGNSASCPPDGFQPSSTQCSDPSCATTVNGDVQTLASFCSGGSASCPTAQKQSCGALLCVGNACSGSCANDNGCSAGNYCSGGNCLPKQPNGQACTANNQCTNGNCVDGVCCNTACGGGATSDCQACNLPGSPGVCTNLAANTVCRASQGVCDPAEVCSGSSTACPADAKSKSGTVCRAAAANSCDVAESCDGVSVGCPADLKQPQGTVCRPAAGPCDVAESCDGTSATCPTDAFKANTVECRASAGPCDIAEKCAGNAAACPKDVLATNAVTCLTANCTMGVATAAQKCSGSSAACAAPQTVSCAPYSCGGSTCLGQCTADVQCDPADYCLMGMCVKRKAVGSQCSSANECENSHCVDGYCCDGGCSGQCEACNVAGKEGVCSAVSGDPIGSRPPCQSDGSKCGGTCGGTLRATCTFPDASVSCRDAGCADSVATLPATCDGAGACPRAYTVDCPGACQDVNCGSDCVTSADCSLDKFCAAGICVKKPAQGQACPDSSNCLCVDGFCCNIACTGQCEACDVSGKEGTCSPATGNPHGARTACTSDNSACAGQCDGTSTDGCLYPGASVACGDASCAASVATLGVSCMGTGRCPAPIEVSCLPAACSGARCAGGCSKDTDCPATQWCAAGVCVPTRPSPERCTSNNQCTLGLCVDGYCCDRACDGQCEACDVSQHEGICTTLASEFPHGGRPACASSGACGGTCLGTDPKACGLPSSEVVCTAGSCSDGVEVKPAVCNGAGVCLPPETATCAPYSCLSDNSACSTGCTTSADCSGGQVCVNGACQIDGSGGASGASGASGTGSGAAAGQTGGAGLGGSAGVGVGPDAGVDAGSEPPGAGSKDAGHCGCRIPGGSSRTPSGAALGVFVAMLCGLGRRRQGRGAVRR